MSNEDKLKPYVFHGLTLRKIEGEEASCDCPFCGREKKFSIHIEDGRWRCLVCAEGTQKGGGNAYVFLRLLQDHSFRSTPVEAYRKLAADRKLLDIQGLIEWGLCQSAITGDWMVPGYNVEGHLTNLYRWIWSEPNEEGKRRRYFAPTPTLGHALFGVNLYDPAKPCTSVCEGIWDGISLWEVVNQCKETTEGLRATANREASLGAQTNVLAVPSANVFFESWLPLFAGKQVTLFPHNDHEYSHPKTGKRVSPAGMDGARRATSLLKGSGVSDIRYARWDPVTHWSPNLKSGWDVRDTLNQPK